MSGRVSVPCWHATTVANAPWKPLIIGEGQTRYQCHEIGGKSDWLGSHCWSRIRMSFNIRVCISKIFVFIQFPKNNVSYRMYFELMESFGLVLCDVQ